MKRQNWQDKYHGSIQIIKVLAKIWWAIFFACEKDFGDSADKEKEKEQTSNNQTIYLIEIF